MLAQLHSHFSGLDLDLTENISIYSSEQTFCTVFNLKS